MSVSSIPRLLVLLALFSATTMTQAKDIVIATCNGPNPCFITANDGPNLQGNHYGYETIAFAQEQLIRFLRDRQFSTLPTDVLTCWPKLENALNDDKNYANSTAFYLYTLGTLPPVIDQGFKVEFAPNARDEAYILETRTLADGRPAVFMCGKTIAGLRAAVYRFRAKVVNEGERLTIAEGREQNDPFIDKRLLIIGMAARRQAPMGSPFREADLETWPEDRIASYTLMLPEFGYNGTQVAECRGYGSLRGDDFKRARKACQVLAQVGRARGLFVSLDQWGDCLFDEGQAYCWNDPKEHQAMLDYMKDMAEAYAPLIDHLNIHIGDPGGCTRNGCDPYKTKQQVMMGWMDAFKKVNPKVQGTLSTWANAAFWTFNPEKVDLANYFDVFLPPGGVKFGQPIPDGGKFLDETFMPKEIGIALNRYYNAQQAELILAAGRKVDIWGWYIGDHEMLDNLAFNMKGIDEYFSGLPDKARDQIRSQVVEICFHGWPQVINTYVQSQKMWNPRRPLDEIEREFCTATYGPQNTDAVLALYRACEGGWNYTIPAPPDFGTASYNEKLRGVLKQSETIKLAVDWKPNFSLPVPAQKWVDMLKARATLILAVSEAKEQVEAARKHLSPELASLPRAGALTFGVQDAQSTPIVDQPAHDHAIDLKAGQTLGQTFRAIREFNKVGLLCPTYTTTNSGLTITLYDAVGGKALASRIETNHPDNSWVWLETHQPAGTYYVEVSNPTGDRMAVYSMSPKVYADGEVYANHKPIENEPVEIATIKREAIAKLPNLPIDPLWKQDATIVNPPFRTLSFAEMIDRL